MHKINERNTLGTPYFVDTKSITVAGVTRIFNNIEGRDGARPIPTFAWVRDASADPTVDHGAALYARVNGSWLKLYETEMMDKVSNNQQIDVTVRWEEIIGKPSSTPRDIDDAVSRILNLQQHTHSNKSILDSLGTTNDGELTFNGVKVDTTNDYAAALAAIQQTLSGHTITIGQHTNSIETIQSSLTSMAQNILANKREIFGEPASGDDPEYLGILARLLLVEQVNSEQTDQITTINSTINGINTTLGEHTAAISDHEIRISALESAPHEGGGGGESVDLGPLERRVTALEEELGLVQSVTSDIEGLLGIGV